ncbi:PSME3-interacting protein-like [Saccostrea echinata]|uniref:PSME3-interacting protein-like n=1 Tax=Saccostrea echinata TaxID=191078 RepID=UPI002A7EACC4|nr:PSME3-interacting protein-like [Saccostrea echinata]
MSSSDLSARFVSQDTLEEKRKKRQEEWDKKRGPDDPEECPEEVIDNRSLYERLQEQKNKKDQEYEEQFALKNSVKGLEEDEVAFLDHVSDRQIAIEKARSSEEARIILELKISMKANVHKIDDSRPKEEKKPTVKQQIGGASNKKSQQALLAGVVKRKSVETSEESKKRKLSSEETSDQKTPSSNPQGLQTAKIIGILPGLGAYDNDTSDSDTSSSDSDVEDIKVAPAKIHLKVVEQE